MSSMALVLIGSRSNSFSANSEPQEFFSRNTKNIFQEVHPQVVLLASSKDFPHITMKLFLELHNDVFYIVLEAIIEHGMKKDSHDMLVSGTSVF